MDKTSGSTTSPVKDSSPTPGEPTKRSPRRDSTEGTKCTELLCYAVEQDEQTFQCNTCKRRVHYRCSELPPYQIYQFTTKNYRNFVCKNCTIIPEHLKNVIPRPPSAVPSKEVSELKKKAKCTQLEVDALAETNRILQAKIRELSKKLNSIEKKYTNEKEEREKVLAGVNSLEAQLVNYEQEITLKDKLLASKESKDDSTSITLSTITDIMTKKFEEIEVNLRQSVLTEVNKCTKQLEKKIDEAATTKTYAQSLTGDSEGTIAVAPPAEIPNFREVIREERNEALAEESEIKLRSCNFVLHGFAESQKENLEEVKQRDIEIVTNFIAELGVEVDYKSIFRLGKNANAQSKRPIKVIMHSEKDKISIMANLNKLKGKEMYKGISVTDDHTLNERNTIRTWVEKAKSANEKEDPASDYVWKCRGTPKNGMFLKKFKKQQVRV